MGSNAEPQTNMHQNKFSDQCGQIGHLISPFIMTHNNYNNCKVLHLQAALGNYDSCENF